MQRLRRHRQAAVAPPHQVDAPRQPGPAAAAASRSSRARKWNSVSDGTTLMPRPARTMPITVASWSTSSTRVHLQRMQRGVEVLAHAAGARQVDERVGREVAQRAAGARSPADGRAGRRGGSGRCRTRSARSSGVSARDGGEREVGLAAAHALDAGLRQHVGHVELDAGIAARGTRASTRRQPAGGQRRQQRDRARGRGAAPRGRAASASAPSTSAQQRGAPTPRTARPSAVSSHAARAAVEQARAERCPRASGSAR